MKTLLTLTLALSLGSAAAPALAGVPEVAIDRFSEQAGHLFKRSANPHLPAANEPIAFDQGPFITHGIGPDGSAVAYYNFDVQPSAPAPIYVLFREGENKPLAGQLNVVDVIPGDPGYNDFWNVVKVTVPADYKANEATSLAELERQQFKMEKTSILVNCPIVPAGSTARLRYNGNADTGLHPAWYKGKRTQYFNFSEKALSLDSQGMVPDSPIFVTFNKNPAPNDPGSGPASGFVTDRDGSTHNVVATLPEDAGYSPLWDVSVYDNTAFGSVHDLESATKAPLLAEGVALVNCPIVEKAAR
jgi:hypothetical protein